MSNEVTSIAKRKIVGSGVRKAVLIYMSDNASDDGSGIWTSKANMAADLELSKRTVQREIQALEDAGVVYVCGRRPCKNGYTVEYAINMAVLLSMKSTRDTQSPVTACHPTRDTQSPQDVTHCHPNHSRTTHEPLYKRDGFVEGFAGRIAPSKQKRRGKSEHDRSIEIAARGHRRFTEDVF